MNHDYTDHIKYEKWQNQQEKKHAACVCVRVWALTPVARIGEAEPAGTGEAWRWGELASSLSYAGLDRKGLCRRPMQNHTWTPQICPQPRKKMMDERKDKVQTQWAEDAMMEYDWDQQTVDNLMDKVNPETIQRWDAEQFVTTATWSRS